MLLPGLALLAIFTLIAVPTAFAETQHIIEPVKGSGFTGCPLVLGCYSPTVTNAQIDDVIEFHNTAFVDHTFTSGTPDGGHDGIFDSGLVLVGSSFEYKADTVGEIPYFCTVHPWMTGLIIVEEQDIALPEIPEIPESPYDEATILFGTGLLSDGTTVKVYTSESMVGEGLTITVKFVDSMHVNYDLTVMQNGVEVLSDKGAHQHEGNGTHITAPLSTTDPITMTITFNGYGVDEITGPTNETLTFPPMPEDDDTKDDKEDLNSIIDQLVVLVDDLKVQIVALEAKMVSFEDRMVSFEDRMVSFEDRMVSFEDRMVSFEDRIATLEANNSDTEPEPAPEQPKPEQPKLATITGTVFVDTNGNGMQDTDESGIETIIMSGSSETTTGADGTYMFGNLSLGDYTVTVTVPEGYTATESTRIVTLAEGDTVTVNFALEESKVPAEPEQPEDTQPILSWIEIDKTEYTLGDTIKVTGFIDPSFLDEKIIDERLGYTNIEYAIQGMSVRPGDSNGVACTRATESWITHYPNLELGKIYVNNDENGDFVFDQARKCIDDSGNFSFDFVVNEHWRAGNHSIHIFIASTSVNPFANTEIPTFIVS